MGSRTGKTKRPRPDPVVKLAATILPPEQCDPRLLEEAWVASYSEADLRHAMRSKETKTVRKRTRVEILTDAGIITKDQAAACDWYLTAHELGYQTVGCTANYTGAGGGGFSAQCLAGRYKAQREARANYLYAKLAIPAYLLGIFEKVVLGPMDIRTLTREDRTRFSLAAFKLHGQIGHMLSIAA